MFIFCLLIFVYSQKIPLSNFHTSSDTELIISIPDFLTLHNDTLTIQGSYNISTQNSVKISSPIQKLIDYPKTLSGSQSQMPIYKNVLYNLWDLGVVLYNVSNPMNISFIEYLNYSDDYIVTVMPVELKTGQFLLSLENGGVYRVINMTNNSEISSMRIVYSMPNFIACTFYQDFNYIWAFSYNSTSVVALRFDLLITFKSQYFRTFQSNDFDVEANMLNFLIYQEVAYICDAVNGIGTFYLEIALENTSNKPELLGIFKHPLNFGNIVNCSMDGLIFTVNTQFNIIEYALPYLGFIRMFAGSYTNAKCGSDFTIAYTEGRIQSFNNSLPIDGALVFDGYMPNYGWAVLGSFLLINTLDTLVLYQLQNPLLVFPAQQENYEFTGYLKTSSQGNYSVYILGSSSSGFFLSRGPYPQYGYIQLSTYENYTYSSSFSFLIPLSNYFSGDFMIYSLSQSRGSSRIISDYAILGNFDVKITLSSAIAVGGYLVIMNSNALQLYNFTNILSSSYFIVTPNNLKTSITSYAIFAQYVVFEDVPDSGSEKTVYREIFSLNGTFIKSDTYANLEKSSKMITDNNNTLYILRSNCVEVYSISGTTLTALLPICGTNIIPARTLEIIDITANNGLYLLDSKLGVLYFQKGYLNYAQLTLPSASYTKLLSNSVFLLVFGENFFYKIAISTYNYNYYPLECENPPASLSQNYLSTQCSKTEIYDLYAEAYESGYVRIQTQGMFILMNTGGLLSNAFDITSSVSFIYTLGSVLTSDLVPSSVQSITTWGLFIINDLIENNNIVINITGTNEYGFGTKTLALTLWNSFFISKNPNFDPNSSSLTSGIINLKLHNFEAPIPTTAFEGNNITYTLLYDDKVIPVSPNCTTFKKVCVESSIEEIFVSPSNSYVYDFAIVGDVLLASVDMSMQIFNINNTVPEYQKSFKFTGFSQYHFRCLNLIFMKDKTNLICAGSASEGNIASYFIISANISGFVYDMHEIYYPSQWTEIKELNNTTFIYLYESVGIYVYEIIEGQVLNKLNYYTGATFNQSFNPVSANYFNETAILVADQYLGLVLIIDNQLYPFINPPSNSLLVDTYLREDSIIVFMSGGDGYLISTTNKTILQHYLKLYPTGYLPFNMGSDINEQLGLIIYPIYTLDHTGYMRVTDLATGEIYTDIFISSVGPAKYFRRILIRNEGFPVIYHDLTTNGKGLPLHTVLMRKDMNVYLSKLEQNGNSTIRLLGIAGNNTSVMDPVELLYKRKSSDNGDDSKDLVEKWWFWLIMAVIIVVVLGAIAFGVYRIMKKRKERCGSQGIEETYKRFDINC